MDEKLIKDAQYRKGLSIAYFNSHNSAIDLVKGKQITDREEELKLIREYRGTFLEDHRNYYASVIAKVGNVYKAEVAIGLLHKATNIEHLKNIWQSLSEDERHDPEIIKAKNEMKKKHEKA